MQIKKLLYSFNELNDTIESIISGVMQETALDEEQIYRIRLVMSELVTNIFKYSGADRVSVDANYEEQQRRLKIELKDNGAGFESETAMKRDVKEDDLLMCENGRGIFLVQVMADSLKYSEMGNVVAVTLKLG